MRYCGPISRGQVTFLTAFALFLSVALNFQLFMTFVGRWGANLSELQSWQADAKVAALKYYVGGVGDQGREHPLQSDNP